MIKNLKKYSIYVFIVVLTFFAFFKMVHQQLYFEKKAVIDSYVELSNVQESDETSTSQETSSTESSEQSASQESTDNSQDVKTTEQSQENIFHNDFKETILSNSVEMLFTDVDKKVGNIIIEKFNLNLPIFEGLNINQDNQLKGAVTNLTNQKMGEGNYVLSSHMTDFDNLLFTSIHKLEKEDIIKLVDDNHTYIYKVYKNFEVYDDETYILRNVKDLDILTLYTCKTVQDTNIRTVIRAVLTSVE